MFWEHHGGGTVTIVPVSAVSFVFCHVNSIEFWRIQFAENDIHTVGGIHVSLFGILLSGHNLFINCVVVF